jgi:hypothetical protein
LDAAFELLRKADNHAGTLPSYFDLLDPFEDLYDMAMKHIEKFNSAEAVILKEYQNNILRKVASWGAAGREGALAQHSGSLASNVAMSQGSPSSSSDVASMAQQGSPSSSDVAMTQGSPSCSDMAMAQESLASDVAMAQGSLASDVASCSRVQHCPCYIALTKEVEELKKKMAHMFEKVNAIANFTLSFINCKMYQY